MTEVHPFQNTWVLWEILHPNPDNKDYDTAVRPICEFSSAEEFWRTWTFIPKPSEVFYDGKTKKYVDNRLIKAFAVFKKGIEPKWEDPANATGSELVTSGFFHPDVFDAFYENLVLGMLGETLVESEQVCGCRVVDQTRKANAKPTYKIELWLRTADAATCGRIKESLGQVLTDGERNVSKVKIPDFDLNKHKS